MEGREREDRGEPGGDGRIRGDDMGEQMHSYSSQQESRDTTNYMVQY